MSMARSYYAVVAVALAVFLAAAQASGATTRWREPVSGMTFAWVPKGCATIGSPEGEAGRHPDERPHRVCLAGFWLSTYEVTNAQYRMFRADHQTGKYRRTNLDEPRQPVGDVTWQEARAFAQWLSRRAGVGFRLPTEAEWEFAARGGTAGPHYWGDDGDLCRHANLDSWGYDSCDDGYKGAAPVGSYAPNPFGLYDMLGNVLEWTGSPYDPGYGGGELRSAPPGYHGRLVVRGGSWNLKPTFLRAASRLVVANDYHHQTIGFRLVAERSAPADSPLSPDESRAAPAEAPHAAAPSVKAPDPVDHFVDDLRSKMRGAYEWGLQHGECSSIGNPKKYSGEKAQLMSTFVSLCQAGVTDRADPSEDGRAEVYRLIDKRLEQMRRSLHGRTQ